MSAARVVESPAYGDPVLGAAVAVAWLIAFLGIAYIAFVRRDA
jgi:ABC-type transport system involved in multi-copper enzyme maturation permease subunit